MLKKLQRKFNVYAALVSFVILQAIGLIIISSCKISLYNGQIREMERIAENNGKIPFDSAHSERNIRYFTVYIKNDDVFEVYIMPGDPITQTDAINLYNKIKKSEGYIGNYSYKKFGDSEEGFVVFLNVYLQQEMLSRIKLLTELCLLGIYLLMMSIIMLVSKYFVQGTVKTYESQMEFINNVSHELKTPLTIIAANNALLRYDVLDQEANNNIDAQIAKMNDMIKQMISLMRLEENHKIVKDKFDLSAAVLDTANGFKIIYEQKHYEYEINVEDGIYYNGAEGLIRQLIGILLENANKYTDDGGKITLAVYKRKHMVYISQKNTYHNVKNVDLNKLFERLYRADNSRGNSSSFGLGLTIAKSIVERHNGKIRANALDDEIEFLIKL